MLRTMLKSKIHRAKVTEAELDYSGSITIDSELLEAADILNHEKVQIVNVTNGSRLETYAIKGKRGSGTVCVNGAAARLCHKGDIIIIISYVHLADAEARQFKPKIVKVAENNKIEEVHEYQETFDAC